MTATRARLGRGRLRMLGWVILGLMLLAAAVVVALLQVPALRVTQVDYRTDPSRLEALRQAAPVTKGQPLVQVDTDAVRQDALSTRLFSTVEVSRSWPSTIVVSATPRTPVVAVKGPGISGVRLVDAAGTPYETVSSAPDGVPVASAAAPSDPAAVRALAAVVTGLPGDLVSSMENLAMDASGMIGMDLGKVAVIWGDAQDSRLKAAVVRDLVDRPDVARIDVSAPMAPVTSTNRDRSDWTPGRAASTGPEGDPSAEVDRPRRTPAATRRGTASPSTAPSASRGGDDAGDTPKPTRTGGGDG